MPNSPEPIYTINVGRSGGPAFWTPDAEIPENEIVIAPEQVMPEIRAEGREWLARHEHEAAS